MLFSRLVIQSVAFLTSTIPKLHSQIDPCGFHIKSVHLVRSTSLEIHISVAILAQRSSAHLDVSRSKFLVLGAAGSSSLADPSDRTYLTLLTLPLKLARIKLRNGRAISFKPVLRNGRATEGLGSCNNHHSWRRG